MTTPLTKEVRELTARAEALREEVMRWPLIEKDLADDGYPEPVAAYIAAAAPSTVLSLLATVRAVEAERDAASARAEKLREALEVYAALEIEFGGAHARDALAADDAERGDA